MRSDRQLLQDMLDSVAEIRGSMPTSKAQFEADKHLQAFLLRHIQIIGEAAWRLSEPVKGAHPAVPWRLMTGMRHVLVHDYFDVNWDRVYETARDDVPTLKLQIEAILASLPPDTR